MPIVKLDYVYKLMKEKDLPYFKVTGGKVLIGKNNEEDDPEKAALLLAEIIEMVEDATVGISLSERTDKAKGRGGSNWDNYCFTVRLRQQEGINGPNAAGGINGTILELLKQNSDLLRKFELQQKENEMAELRREIKDLKEKKNEPDVIEKYLPLLAAHFSGKPATAAPVAIHGTDDEPINEDAMQKARAEAKRMQKIKLALMRLSKVDKNLPDTLTVVADFAEQHPDKYAAFVPMIKSQL